MLLAHLYRRTIEGALIDVWHIDLRAPADDRLLSPDEGERAARLRIETKRRRFIAARAGLRLILAEYAQRAPDALIFGIGVHGKPYLVNTPGVEFNLTHSEDTALVAVSSQPVGIDIEQVRDLSAMEQIAAIAFTPDEQTAIVRLHELERAAAFFRTWTRKEALMKARGDGFRLAKTFSVPTETHRSIFRVDGYAVCDLVLPDALVGAVAVRGVAHPVIE